MFCVIWPDLSFTVMYTVYISYMGHSMSKVRYWVKIELEFWSNVLIHLRSEEWKGPVWLARLLGHVSYSTGAWKKPNMECYHLEVTSCLLYHWASHNFITMICLAAIALVINWKIWWWGHERGNGKCVLLVLLKFYSAVKLITMRICSRKNTEIAIKLLWRRNYNPESGLRSCW